MAVLAGGDEGVLLALLVGPDPERDEEPACGVAALALLELDHLAVPRALLHPDGEVGEPLEDGVLLLDHDLHLLCVGCGGKDGGDGCVSGRSRDMSRDGMMEKESR